MRLKRLCLAATVAGLLSGCAASRSASVNLVEQVDVPPSHSQQYNPRKTCVVLSLLNLKQRIVGQQSVVKASAVHE